MNMSLDGAIMARARARRQQDVTDFVGCGLGKYCYILLGLTSLMPLKPSHNLLVRGSNPGGGTTEIKVMPMSFRFFDPVLVEKQCTKLLETNLSPR
jgi:hypothetical protein